MDIEYYVRMNKLYPNSPLTEKVIAQHRPLLAYISSIFVISKRIHGDTELWSGVKLTDVKVSNKWLTLKYYSESKDKRVKAKLPVEVVNFAPNELAHFFNKKALADKVAHELWGKTISKEDCVGENPCEAFIDYYNPLED